MKITKAPKRLAEATPQVKNLLDQISKATDEELPAILDGISDWCWPRGDLHYWTRTLNRFDDILEQTCRDYDLHKLQINEFTPLRKRLVVSVLRFTRLLIENCTNRKLYASYEHLNGLLFTRDVDVLEATLRLILRPAQQHSSQGSSRHDLQAAQDRLGTLAVTWVPREHGLEMTGMAREQVDIPPELLHVRFQFYRRAKADAEASTSAAGEVAAAGGGGGGGGVGEDDATGSRSAVHTPSRPRARQPVASHSAGAGLIATPSASASAATAGASDAQHRAAHSEGMTTIDLGRPAESACSAMDILADAVEEHGIPEEDHFELFQRIRLAMSLPDAAARRQLLVCRLLAIACYAHLVPESTAATQLFLYELDIIPKTAALVDPETRAPQEVQSSALYALDALGRYRGKLNEVLNSINASVNHGVLLQVLRNVVEDLAGPTPQSRDHLIDALFGLIAFLTSTALGSTMVVNAGLVPLLNQLVEKTQPTCYMLQRTVTRAIGLLDTVIYAFPAAFTFFCESRGLDVFVTRIEREVEGDVAECKDAASGSALSASATSDPLSTDPADNLYGHLSFGRAQLLRNLFKSISHMMTSTGTAEGLRNLIDTSLLDSLRRVIEERRVFGPQILALCVNIMSTFIHNEPTSLGTIQEKKLPEAFLDAMHADIEANFDLISAVPNAIGALSLNQAGLDMLRERPLVPKLFGLFTSARHSKVLQDRDSASMFGANIDELIRHFPELKKSVFDEILSTLKRIDELGRDFVPAPEDEAIYTLRLVKRSTDAMDEDGASSAEASGSGSGTKSLDPAHEAGLPALADIALKTSSPVRRDAPRSDNEILGFMDNICRFLDGLTQTSSHCKDFLKLDGLQYILRFPSLPCVPYDWGSTFSNDSLVTLLRYTVELSPNAVLTAVLKEVKRTYDAAADLVRFEGTPSSSVLARLMAPADDAELASARADFRKLVALNASLELFTDIAPAFAFASTKLPTTFLQIINSTKDSSDMIKLEDLGDLMRSMAWEATLFKAVAPRSVDPRATAEQQAASNGAGSLEMVMQPGMPVDILTDVPGEVGGVREGGADATAGSASLLKGKSSSSSSSASSPTGSTPPKVDDPRGNNAHALSMCLKQIPSNPSSVFAGITRLLITRRSHDASHRKQAVITATTLGGILRRNLEWREAGDKAFSFAYATSVVGHASAMLYDGGSANTLVLHALAREDGVAALMATVDRYILEIGAHFDERGEQLVSSGERLNPEDVRRSILLGHACGGLKVALNTLAALVASKPLLESPSTLAMASKDSVPKTDPEYFEAHEFLVRLRLAVLPSMAELWRKPWLGSMPFGVNRAVMRILLAILKAEGEEVPPKREPASTSANTTVANLFGSTRDGAGLGGSGGAGGDRTSPAVQTLLSGLTGALGAFPGAVPQRRGPVRPSEEHIAQLVEMGFPRAAARQALQRCSNNTPAAAEYLLMHPEIVANPDPEPEPEPEPEAEQSNEPAAATTAAGETADAEMQETQQTNDEGSGDSAAAPSAATGAADGNDAEMADAAGGASGGERSSEGASSSDPLGATAAPAKAVDEERQKEREAEAQRAVDAEKEALDAARKDLRPNLIPRALELADKHEALVFDIKDMIGLAPSEDEGTGKAPEGSTSSSSPSSKGLSVLRMLVGQIREAAPQASAGSRQEAIVAVRLRLIALILQDATVVKSLDATFAREAVASLRELAQVASTGKPEKWLASYLLVTSEALALEGSPIEVKVQDPTAKPDGATETESASPAASAIEAPWFAEEAHLFFKHALGCLERAEHMSRQDMLALYRLLVILTRRHAFAAELVKEQRLATLLRPFATKPFKDMAGCQPLVMLILRHVLEDRATLRATMVQEIKAHMSTSRTKTVESTIFARVLGHVMLRDPDLFLEVAREQLELADYNTVISAAYLQAIPSAAAKTSTAPAAPPAAATSAPGPDESMELPPSPTKAGPSSSSGGGGASTLEAPMAASRELPSTHTAPASEELDGVMQFLLSELLRTLRDQQSRPGPAAKVGDKPGTSTSATGATASTAPATASSGGATAAPETTEETSAEDAEADASYFYSCFLMQALTELLSSYNGCKLSFVSANKRKLFGPSSHHAAALAIKEGAGSAPALGPPHAKTKPSQAVLQFFLTELVPIGFLKSCEHAEMRRRMAQSNWAMSVIVALTADLAVHADVREVASDLVNVRRTVLDGISKAIKDAASSPEPFESRYGRLYSLADLCYRLLTARPNLSPLAAASGGSRQTDDLTLQMAKTMLEKGFVNVLTGALADVDLNLPMVKSLLERILRPLEHLTKVANKMSKAERKGDKAQQPAQAAADDDDSSVWSSSGYDSMSEDDSEDDEGPGGALGAEGDGREDTPDFYRNSSLGRWTGEMAEGAEDEFDEDDDEDDEMDEEDVEMEYGTDEDGSDISTEDEDDEMEHVVEVIGEEIDDTDSEDEDDELDGEEGTVDEDSWTDDDDEEDEEDEDEDALDFVLGEEGAADDLLDGAVPPGTILEELGDDELDMFHRGLAEEGHEMGDEDEQDEDEEDSMEEEMYDQDDLSQLEFAEPATYAHPPEDRFGANWGWANMTSLPRAGGVPAGQVNGAGIRHVPMLPILFDDSQQGGSSRHRRINRFLDPSMPFANFGSGRSRDANAAGNDVTSHPLLVDQAPPSSGQNAGSSQPARWRRRGGNGAIQPGYNDWANSIQELVGGGAMQFLEQLLQRGGAGAGGGENGAPAESIQITIGGPDGTQASMQIGGITMERGAGGWDSLNPSRPFQRRPTSTAAGGGAGSASSPSTPARVDPVAAVQQFSPMPTGTRWQEAMRITFGSAAGDRASRLRPQLVNALVPAYRKAKAAEAGREAQNLRKWREQAEESRKRKADDDQAPEAEAGAGAGAGAGAEASSSSTATPATAGPSTQAAEPVTSEPVTTEPVTQAAEPAAEPASTSSTQEQRSGSGDADMSESGRPNLELDALQRSLGELDAAAATTLGEDHDDEDEDEDFSDDGSSDGEDDDHDAVEREGEGDAQGASDAAAQSERVIVTVNGAQVDITDSGIDPTFLEALPEDMQEEILNQHFRERRAAAATRRLTQAGASAIAPEFLDALPPDIRAEVINQELAAQQATQAARQQAQRAATATAGGAGASTSRTGAGAAATAGLPDAGNMDPVDFLASLSEEARNAIMQGQDQTMLQGLPAPFAAEIQELRRHHRRFQGGIDGGAGASRQAATDAKRAAPHRDAIQLLDKPGVATLVRLLYFPQLSGRSSGLHKVLANLQENSRTRVELLNLLLMILEGTEGTHGVDKSYASMSMRASRAAIGAANNTSTPSRPAPRRNMSTPGGLSGSTGALGAPGTPGPAAITAAPLSRAGDEAPFLIATRSIETLYHLTASNEQAALHFLREDARPEKKRLGKGKDKASGASAPINVLLSLLTRPTILKNAQLVDSLIALLNTVTKPLTTLPKEPKSEQPKIEDKPEDGDATVTAADNAPAATDGGDVAGPSSTTQPEADKAPGTAPPNEGQLTVAPHIPEERMSAIVKPLGTAISSRGFQNTLAVASHLATIPGARDTICKALREEAEAASRSLIDDLDKLLETLPAPAPEGDEDEKKEQQQQQQGLRDEPMAEDGAIVRGGVAAGATSTGAGAGGETISSPALNSLASPASAQAVMLRSLRALEWIMTRPNAPTPTSSAPGAPNGSGTAAANGVLSQLNIL